jgi:hypothetical protein
MRVEFEAVDLLVYSCGLNQEEKIGGTCQEAGA